MARRTTVETGRSRARAIVDTIRIERTATRSQRRDCYAVHGKLAMLKRNNYHPRRRASCGIACASFLALALVVIPPAKANDCREGNIRFGAPPWPAVTIKTEIVSQILEAIGYDTSQQTVSLSITYEGLKQGELDVFLANWSPFQNALVKSYLEEGSLVRIARQIDDALGGMAVPRYVWEAGVHSVSDVDRYADRFNNKFYAIQPGASATQLYKAAVANNTAGLGDWKVVTSSTAGMLAAVGNATRRNDWIIFNGWKPHWMFAVYDLKILKDPTNTGLSAIESEIYTVVQKRFAECRPNLARFFKQFKLDSAVQSEWVRTARDREQSAVAREWISEHLDIVERWLKDVETRDGESAIAAVRAQYEAE